MTMKPITPSQSIQEIRNLRDLLRLPGEKGSLTASRTANRDDLGVMLYSSGSSAISYTLPPDSGSDPFIDGEFLIINNKGSGLVTLVAGAGVTINNLNGLVSAGQYAIFGAIKEPGVANTWTAFGNLTSA